MRGQAAAIIDVSNSKRLKLLYKGQYLKGDFASCGDYNLKNQSKIVYIVAESPLDEDGYVTKRKRKTKKKRKEYPKPSSSDAPKTPNTPMEKLRAISSHFQTKILPLCV